MLYLPSQTHLY